MFRSLCLAIGLIAITNFVFARDLEADLIKRVSFDSNTGNGSQIRPISFSSNNEFFYTETYFNSLEYTRPSQFRKTDSFGVTHDLQIKIGNGVPCYSGAENCWMNQQSYNISASSKGIFSVYNYSNWETTGSTTVLVQSSINNGPALDNILLDLNANGYNSEPIVKVNNNGIVAAFLQRKISDSVQLPYELAVINPDGTKRTLMYARYPGMSYYDIALEINDFDTVFYWDGFKVYAFEKNGASKIVAEIPYHEFLLRYIGFSNLMYAPNITSDEHPEGILYYKKVYNQIYSTQDGLIVDASAYGSIANFAVNENKKIVFSAFNAPYNATSSAIFIGPDLINDKLIESGEKINGEVADLPISLGLNENMEFLIGFGTKPNPYHLQYQREVFVKASLAPKICHVHDKNVNVQFWSQLDPRWNMLDTKKVPKTDWYALTKPYEMKISGCNTTTHAMLLDAYGLTTMPDGTATNPLNLNRNLATVSKGSKYPYGIGYNSQRNVVYSGVVAVAKRGWIASCPNSVDQCLDEANTKISYLGAKDTMNPEDVKVVEDELCNGNPVTLRLTKRRGGGTHFVLATGFDYVKDASGKLTKTFIFNDVGRRDAIDGEGANLVNQIYSDKYRLSGYRLYRGPTREPAALRNSRNVARVSAAQISGKISVSASGSKNIHFVVTDPDGKRTGFNPKLNIKYDENLNAQYFYESVSNPAIDQDVDVTIGEGFNYENIDSFVAGSYKFEVYGVASGPFEISINSADSNGNINNTTAITGNILAGETKIINHLTSSEKVLIPNKKLEIKIGIFQNDLPHKDREQLYLLGKIANFEINKIDENSMFSISVGGLGGYKNSIPFSNFKNLLGVSYYTDNDISIYLYKTGDIVIKANKVNLDSISQEKWGNIILTVGNNIAEGDLGLKCLNRICVLKD